MNIEFNNLLVALIFLLPGFLTSRLISARTPSIGKEASLFQETFGSLLRSILIHIIIAPFAFVYARFVLLRGDNHLISRIDSDGLQAFFLERPFQVTLVLFGWLLFAFIIAIIFGYFKDPLEILFDKLVKKTRTSSEDVFYQLRDFVVKKRNSGEPESQLWIQARLKNGYTYQGEFVFAGYRQDGMSRELMLTHVKFFPYPAQIESRAPEEAKLYDYVVIDVANCDSLEILIGKGASK